MSLEEEIAINQFGQGVRSATDILHPFAQLNRSAKMKRFLALNALVYESKPLNSDIQQAIIDSSLDDTYVPCFVPRHSQWASRVYKLPPGELENDYTFLLHLFKIAYKRRFELEKGNPAKWWYWDLSSAETVKSLLKTHHELIEAVYNNASFRSEFRCITKLWNDLNNSEQNYISKLVPEHSNLYDFITYKEMQTRSMSMMGWYDKRLHAISILRHSLEKGLAIRYGIDSGQVMKITLAVIDKHMRIMYNKPLDGFEDH